MGEENIISCKVKIFNSLCHPKISWNCKNVTNNEEIDKTSRLFITNKYWDEQESNNDLGAFLIKILWVPIT